MAGPWDNMNPEFSSRVQALIAASGGRVRPGSGFRTVEEQIALRKKNGCPNVWTSPASSCRVPTAIPGQSNHNHGLAMDLVYSGDGAAWAAKNAARFGLHFPVRGENWHVEMIDDNGSRGHVRGAMGRGAIGFDVRWQEEQRSPEDELSHRLDQIMSIVTGGADTSAAQSPESPIEAPSMDVEAPTMAEDLMRTDVTEIPGGESQSQTAGFAGDPASGDRLGNARLIAQVGRQMGVPDAAIKIALAASLVESNLKNVNHGDRDSLGLFQQRPSQGWGSASQVMDPTYAATKFYSALMRLKNWQGMNPGAAAQAVQRSAYPGRYSERYGEAVSIFNQLGRF